MSYTARQYCFVANCAQYHLIEGVSAQDLSRSLEKEWDCGKHSQTPVPNDDIRHAAAGNLAYLLSVIRSGEKLHENEEAHVRKIIEQLELESVAATTPADRDDYVAWCRYTYNDQGGIQTIKTCNSDSKGAFKVYTTRRGWSCSNCGKAHSPEIQTCPNRKADDRSWGERVKEANSGN